MGNPWENTGRHRHHTSDVFKFKEPAATSFGLFSLPNEHSSDTFLAMRILLTGASGFLGREVATRLAVEHLLTPVGGRTAPPHGLTADLRDPEAWSSLLRRAHPDAIVHLAAYREPDFCEENPAEARRLNTAPLAWLADHLDPHVLLIFTSTDYVFSGNEPPYREDSPRSPVNEYGASKMEAEDCLAGRPNTLVLRIPLLVGTGPTIETSGFLFEALRAIRNPAPQSADNVLRRFPTWTRDVADFIGFALKNNTTGTLHYSGPDGLTRFQMIHIVAEALGLPASHIQPSDTIVPRRARRPLDSQLDTQRVRALGYSRFTRFSDVVRNFAAAHSLLPL